ncbi:MAG TPA: amino acid permease [Xanthobacteraceae bacterium]|nr:amino acid permease [Xanthobacteraceae bacterium]
MKLKAVLGPVQLVFYSVGVIVGAGVYSVIGAAAGLAGEGLWLSFMLAAVVAALTALSYAEMATAFPAAGAEYVYARRALPEARSISVAMAAVILFGAAATAATVALAFGGYLQLFFDVSPIISAALLLAFCTAVNVLGIREASWVNVLFTSIELAGLLLVIGVGLTREGFLDPVATPQLSGVLPAAAIIFFVYLGFEEVANLAEEVRNPARDIPRALFISLGITTTLYVLVALAAVALAPPADLAASGAPLATALQQAWPQGSWVLSAIALFATANTVLITLIATSRLAYSMAREGDLPGALGNLALGRRTPWVAAILALAMSAILLPLGDLKILAQLSSFSALIAFLAVNFALIILRYRLPNHPRPFLVPWSVGRMPILPAAAILSIILLLVSFDQSILIATVLILLIAISLVTRRYLMGLKSRRRKPRR